MIDIFRWRPESGVKPWLEADAHAYRQMVPMWIVRGQVGVST